MKKKVISPLRITRIVLATLVMLLLTLLILDFTGTLHRYFSWLAKVQLLPAILAGNVLIVGVLLLVTLLFGRVYCSVICPLGIMQDAFSWLGSKRKKNRFRPHKAHNILRYVVLALFIVLMLVGLQSIAILIAPYSAYVRIVDSIFSPLYALCNNLLASIAAKYDSYAFYSTDVWLKSGITLAIALITFFGIGTLAFLRGRLWCNTICPVGGLLSLVSKYSLFRPTIDADKCTKCRKCERNCKAECIDINTQSVDMSRCVGCMNCLEQCHFKALSYSLATKNTKHTTTPTQTKSTQDTPTQGTQAHDTIDTSRRRFLTTTAAVAATAALSAQHKTTDGGLAIIEKKKVPHRAVPLKPAGSQSLRHFSKHCTACQLCVSQCPHQVLRPSSSPLTLMQPEMGFEHGFCHTHCHTCSDMCPTGAILPLAFGEKEGIQIGHAVWIKENCVVLTDHVHCGNCAKHCPVHAIMMVETDDGEIPVVDEQRCIGCGKCEHLCPARPFSAIYVEGHEEHKII